MSAWNRVLFATICGAMLSATVLSGTAAAQRQSTDKLLPTQQQLSPFNLERAWWGQATLNASRDKVRYVSVDEDLVYVQATSGVTTAFDSETGQRMWAAQLGRFDQPSFPAVSNEELALIVVGSTLYGIDKRTGQTVWTLVLPGQPSTGPSVDENQVYIGMLDGSVYAFSLRKIRQLYRQQRLPQWSHEALVWRYKTAKEISSPPIVTGRVVNFASRDGSLYSVSAADRKLQFQLETDAPIVAPLARTGKLQYMASEDFTFYALNLDNGKVVWKFTSGLPIRRAPFAIGTDLYITPDRGGMYCLDAVTGVQRWWQPSLSRFVSVTGAAMFASDDDGNLLKVSRDTGAIIGSLSLRVFSVRVSNDRTDRLYLSTESGMIIALRQKGELLPVFHKFPDRLPIVPLVEPEEPATDEAKPTTTEEAKPTTEEAKPATEGAIEENAK